MIAFTSEVLRSSATGAQRAEALRLRAMASSELALYDRAIEAANEALDLEPDVPVTRDINKVSSAELRALIPLWQSFLLRY